MHWKIRKRIRRIAVEITVKPAEYLKRPYGRMVIPEPDGTFRAEIIEFPGCIAVGDTVGAALANLERAADSWLQATIGKGLRVPEPIERGEYRGERVVRRLRPLLPQHLGRQRTR